jgi:glycosyltransferase involved in cell wall biosynthesis
MRVSIIITVFNGEDGILNCLKSIIQQSYKDIEIIVFDDGSTDATRNKINEFISDNSEINIIFKYEYENIGRCHALNECLNLASGNYVAIMDADDVMYPNRILNQLKFLLKNKNIQVVGGSQLMMMKDGQTKINNPPRNDKHIKASLFIRTTMLHPTVMMDRSFLVKNSIKYNQDYMFPFEDYKLFIDIANAGGSFANLTEVVNTYDFSSQKRWEVLSEPMITCLGRIWGDNLAKILVTPNNRNFEMLLKVTHILPVKNSAELFRILIFLFKTCTLKTSSFGGRFSFARARMKDFLVLVKRAALNTGQ